MSVVIAHLTDLHIKSAEDPVLARSEVIARAIASEVRSDTTLVVLAIGGDSAFSGETSQFDEARTFYLRIKEKLERERPKVTASFVLVAGNHDCEFNACGTIPASPKQASAEPTALLRNYFAFAASFDLDHTPHRSSSPFIASCDFDTDGHILRFLLINTSLSSQLHEQPGSLSFPVGQLLAPPEPRAQYVVSLLHHPWNWFSQPDVMRPLRDRIEELSDVILTGHEHSPEVVSVTRQGTASSLYVSGGVLQDNDRPSESSFITVHLDMHRKTQSTVQFKLNLHGFYERENPTEPHEFRGNPARIGRPFDLAPTFEKELKDLGFPIQHSGRPLSLADIFTYPDLLVVDEPASSESRQIKSKDVARTILSKSKALISGGDKSGKTCFAKSLFQSARAQDRIPIFLNGKEVQSRKVEALRENIRRCARSQYSFLDPDQYEQLDRKSRVVIIDDFELMVREPETRQRILLEFEEIFSCVVLVGSETVCFDLLQESQETHLWQYTHYNILSFGEVLREQFIRKWLSLPSDSPPSIDLREEVPKIGRLINGVIRKTLLPAYPLFLMIVLQQIESGQPTVRGGSYGHLFEAVVTRILNGSRFTKVSIAAKHRYLSTLAYELYQRNLAALPEDEVLAWHTQYWKTIGVSVEFEKSLRDFVELNILQVVNGKISFRYKYHYCFFVAYYLSENITNQAVRETIRQICAQTYHAETGDILLFLSHLSNDSIILDEMLNAANKLLSAFPEANLKADVAKLNQLQKTAPVLALESATPDQKRKQQQEDEDKRIDDRSAARADGATLSARPDNQEDMEYDVVYLPASFKTIQVLGQFARNHADSLPVDTKKRVLECCFSLAKRIMGGFFQMLETDLPQISNELAASVKRDNPDIARDELLKQIGRHVFGVSQLICFVVTKLVSSSSGHELIESIAADVAAANPDLPNEFFDLAISLERPGHIDLKRLDSLLASTTGNPFGVTLLRMLVMHHIYLFNVNYRIRQAAIEKLKVIPDKSPLLQDRKRLK